MKIYSVSIPVYASVQVYVKASSEDAAEEIANSVAHIYDAEPIDFALGHPPDVIEVGTDDISHSEKIWISEKDYIFNRKQRGGSDA